MNKILIISHLDNLNQINNKKVNKILRVWTCMFNIKLKNGKSILCDTGLSEIKLKFTE